jgi:hypothetical protein
LCSQPPKDINDSWRIKEHLRVLSLIETPPQFLCITGGDTKALKEHIVALYCDRYTCRQIADLTGLSYRYIRDSLKERGITPVSRVGRASRVRRLDRTSGVGQRKTAARD